MAELVEVKIRCTVVTSQYGTLESGDILRTNAEFAKHLVEQCAAGDYVVKKEATKEEPKPKVKASK